MDSKLYAKRSPPTVSRSKSLSSSSSQFHSTKGRQRYSSIHGGHGLPPAVRHINNATVVPTYVSDDIDIEPNPSYAQVSILHSGRGSAESKYIDSEGQVSFSESLSLHQFVQQHSKSLPVRVKVVRGYYGQSADSELITDDLYDVHFVKHQKVVTIRDIKDTKRTVYSVPLASTLQFGLVFNLRQNMDGTTFHKASDIMALKVLPKVVCATKAFQGADEKSSVRENEILRIQSVEIHGTEVLEVFSFTTNNVKILQANCEGDFSTKPSLIRLHLPDILTCIPCKAVMFIDETVTPQATARKFPSSILSGPIRITESKVETSLVASLSSKTSAHKDPGKITLLDIPLADHLAEVEVAILESPSTQEVQLLGDDTRRIMRDFHPNKLKYLREMRSARAARLQSLLYAEVQKGQKILGIELESSIVDQMPLTLPSPIIKSRQRGAEKPLSVKAHLPSIPHQDDMRSTLEQVAQKLLSLDNHTQKLNLESAPVKNSSSSMSPKEENKQYLHSLDNTQVRKC